MIGLVTDSNSQLPADLADRFAVEIVAMTVTVDGVDHLEGVDLDADGFYDHFQADAAPEISTSQPSPGAFTVAYERLVARGCTEIVSIHLAESMSGTLASAAIAARSSPVPVHVIDTGSASFGVAVCVWAAGAAIERGAGCDEVRRVVAELVPRIGTAFMIGVPFLTERSGRANDLELGDDAEGIAVVAMSAGAIEVLDRVTTVSGTVDVMARYATSRGHGVTVALGTADEPSRRLTDRLESALTGAPGVDAIVHYRIGPSVGAHTGPGTFGLFVFPTID